MVLFSMQSTAWSALKSKPISTILTFYLVVCLYVLLAKTLPLEVRKGSLYTMYLESLFFSSMFLKLPYVWRILSNLNSSNFKIFHNLLHTSFPCMNWYLCYHQIIPFIMCLGKNIPFSTQNFLQPDCFSFLLTLDASPLQWLRDLVPHSCSSDPCVIYMNFGGKYPMMSSTQADGSAWTDLVHKERRLQMVELWAYIMILLNLLEIIHWDDVSNA